MSVFAIFASVSIHFDAHLVSFWTSVECWAVDCIIGYLVLIVIG